MQALFDIGLYVQNSCIKLFPLDFNLIWHIGGWPLVLNYFRTFRRAHDIKLVDQKIGPGVAKVITVNVWQNLVNKFTCKLSPSSREFNDTNHKIRNVPYPKSVSTNTTVFTLSQQPVQINLSYHLGVFNKFLSSIYSGREPTARQTYVALLMTSYDWKANLYSSTETSHCAVAGREFDSRPRQDVNLPLPCRVWGYCGRLSMS